MSEEEIITEAESIGNFLSVSTSQEKNSLPSSTTTIEHKDEDIDADEMRYTLP